MRASGRDLFGHDYHQDPLRTWLLPRVQTMSSILLGGIITTESYTSAVDCQSCLNYDVAALLPAICKE